MKGWYRDSYRHALSAKGIKNRYNRYSFAIEDSLGDFDRYASMPAVKVIRHSTKGNYSKPFDPKYVNKYGKVVDQKKSLQAMGYATTGGRPARKVGDQVIPSGAAPIFGPGGQVIPGLSNGGISTLSQEELTGIPEMTAPYVPMEMSTMPTVPSSYGLEQQTRLQVEGGPQAGSTPLSGLPGYGMAEKVMPKILEGGKEPSKAGLIEGIGVGTSDIYEPSPLDTVA